MKIPKPLKSFYWFLIGFLIFLAFTMIIYGLYRYIFLETIPPWIYILVGFVILVVLSFFGFLNLVKKGIKRYR